MIGLAICNELFENWEFERVCDTVKALGYDGLEIAPFTLAPRISAVGLAERNRLARVMTDRGLRCVGLHWLLAKTEGFGLTHPDPSIRRATADYLIELAEATGDLGGSLMVLGSPKQRDLAPGVTYEQGVAYLIEAIEHLLPTLERRGVDLCLEPLAPAETNFLNTCAQTVAILERLGHPERVKLHLDVKAQSSETEADVPTLIGRYAKFAGHFHANDVNLRGPGMGKVDFKPILAALVASGYDRFVSVEVFDFSPGAEETARISIQTLKDARDAAIGSSPIAS